VAIAHVEAREDMVDQLDLHVRELVRREGVDPQRDAALVRRIAERVVRDHDERSLTGIVASVPDAAAVVGELVARVSGFGPLQPFLDDPSVEEVWINHPSRVFVARRGRHELTNLVLTAAQVTELVERMLKSSGRRLDVSAPFVDAMLPEGHRLHVVLEGISRGFSAVNIRKQAHGGPIHLRERVGAERSILPKILRATVSPRAWRSPWRARFRCWPARPTPQTLVALRS